MICHLRSQIQSSVLLIVRTIAPWCGGGGRYFRDASQLVRPDVGEDEHPSIHFRFQRRLGVKRTILLSYPCDDRLHCAVCTVLISVGDDVHCCCYRQSYIRIAMALGAHQHTLGTNHSTRLMEQWQGCRHGGALEAPVTTKIAYEAQFLRGFVFQSLPEIGLRFFHLRRRHYSTRAA